MRRVLLMMALLLMAAAPSFAQDTPPPILDGTLRIYLPGASQPLSEPTVIPMGSWTCDLEPPATQPRTSVLIDDPARDGRVCRWVDATGGPLHAVPIGPHEGTLTWRNENGSGPESARAGFTRWGPPAVATGLRIRP